jgi:hypothetical protein
MIQSGHNKFKGALNFEPADISPAEDIARMPGGNGDMREPVNAAAVIKTNILLDSARTGSRPYQAKIMAYLRCDDSGVLKAIQNQRLMPEKFYGNGSVLECSRAMGGKFFNSRFLKTEASSPRPDKTPSEPVSAYQCRRIEKIASNSPAV